MKGIKTRSAMYLRQMNDDVKSVVTRKAEELGVANWVVVEKILESALDIKGERIDIKKYLGTNANRARLGKAYKAKPVK